MTKLLSDEELHKQLKSILEAELSAAEVAAYAAGNKEAITDIMRHQLFDLINTQKRLYAESVLNSLTDNERKVWLYQEDFDKRINAAKEAGISIGRDEAIVHLMQANTDVFKDYMDKLRAEQRARIK